MTKEDVRDDLVGAVKLLFTKPAFQLTWIRHFYSEICCIVNFFEPVSQRNFITSNSIIVDLEKCKHQKQIRSVQEFVLESAFKDPTPSRIFMVQEFMYL